MSEVASATMFRLRKIDLIKSVLIKTGLIKIGLMTAGAVLLALSVVLSCSRPAAEPDAAAVKTDQPLVDGGQQSGSSGGSVASSEVRVSQAKSENKLIPTAAAHSLAAYSLSGHSSGAHSFSDSDILPAGTLLTVRLEKALSADAPEAGGVFDAVVEEPVVVNGVTIIPQGVGVAGRIEAARASALKRSRAYVRLTLASIEVGGRDLAIQTSSLFARGRSDATAMLEDADSFGSVTPIGSVSPISLVNSVHLEKGRLLTFRLVGPVTVPGERAVAAR
jgi:hypothetical protein